MKKKEKRRKIMVENVNLIARNSLLKSTINGVNKNVALSEEDKKEKGLGGIAKPKKLSTDYDYYSKSKYLNLSEKSKRSLNKCVTGKIILLPKSYNYNTNSNYINFSINKDFVGDAVVTGEVTGLPYKQYLLPKRSLGSIPNSSSDFQFNNVDETKVKTFSHGESPTPNNFNLNFLNIS